MREHRLRAGVDAGLFAVVYFRGLRRRRWKKKRNEDLENTRERWKEGLMKKRERADGMKLFDVDDGGEEGGLLARRSHPSYTLKDERQAFPSLAFLDSLIHILVQAWYRLGTAWKKLVSSAVQTRIPLRNKQCSVTIKRSGEAIIRHWERGCVHATQGF